jgi:uncharacterized RDD family membrane protein YckC
MRSESTKLYVSKRVYATIIDYSIVWAFSIFYIVEAGHPNDNGGYTIDGWPALIPVLFWFLYIVIAEHYMGGTASHLIFKIKVVSLTNEKITLWRTFKRRIADVLEIAWCFGLIAYLLASNTTNNQRLGDVIAKTCVIGKDDLNQEVVFDFEKKL